MEPNVYAYNILLKAMCKNDGVDGARNCLVEMSKKGCLSDAVSYTTVVSVLAQMFVRGCSPNVHTYAFLIKGCFVEGRVHESLDLRKRMICEGFRPNIVAYTTRIHDLCTNGKMGDAVSVCYEMERNGSPRPHIALLLMALQKQVPLLAALQLYNMMNRGCRPNVFLDGLFKANRFEEAYGIVREIKEIRMGLNLETYNTTLNGFSSGWNAKEAMQILGKMLLLFLQIDSRHPRKGWER
ncbi:pentatricopeptide repeat-containing protein At3g48810-like [Malus domestica]|uniref:pentatricopeptide repeat-containing protein At3g48810-like n=1 Tax=Malus domestica TaxID=3750 RepID=UPI003975E418